LSLVIGWEAVTAFTFFYIHKLRLFIPLDLEVHVALLLCRIWLALLRGEKSSFALFDYSRIKKTVTQVT